MKMKKKKRAKRKRFSKKRQKQAFDGYDEDSSYANRRGKTAQLSVGFAHGKLGVFLTPDVTISGEYDQSDILLGLNAIPDSSQRIGVGLEAFLGNSFYLHGGFAQRTLKYSNLSLLETIFEGLDDQPQRSVTYTDKGSTLGFGNRWQWEYFSIDCRWVGFYIPFGGPETITYNDEAAADQEWLDREAQDRDGLTAPNYTGSLSFGFAF